MKYSNLKLLILPMLILQGCDSSDSSVDNNAGTETNGLHVCQVPSVNHPMLLPEPARSHFSKITVFIVP